MFDNHSAHPVERYLAAIADAAIADCDALSPEMTLDATVPNWRFTVCGGPAVRAELGRWYADAGSFEELRRTPLPDGELVEFTLRWEEAGVPHAVHQAHVLEVLDGQITHDKVWCGGRWSAGAARRNGRGGQSRRLICGTRSRICWRGRTGRCGCLRTPSPVPGSSGW